jgi:hypothetical protein
VAWDWRAYLDNYRYKVIVNFLTAARCGPLISCWFHLALCAAEMRCLAVDSSIAGEVYIDALRCRWR